MKTLLSLLPFLLAACSGHHAEPAPQVSTPRPVSILVEVYDPITNFVWENVSVRVVEASHEWSGCTCASPYIDWFPTDSSGRVMLSEYDLAYVQVGFLEDGAGRAIIRPYRDEDEATVLLQIDALGFTPVFVEVPIRWDQADVFVEVPFN